MKDMLANYQQYNPGFQQMQSPRPSKFAAALPYVQAGMQGAGLLAGLYGNYRAAEIAEDNAEQQRKEFEYQRRMEEERIEREKQQQSLANTYASASRADQGEDNRLAKYQGYFRNIGF